VRALITGVGGFAGRHLTRHLADQGDVVLGVARPADAADLPGPVEVFHADLLDRAATERVVAEARPDAIFHLAAQSSTVDSLRDPWLTIANNMQAQLALFDAVREAGLRPRILVVGTSEEYGHVDPRHIPTAEDAPLRPVTPYGVSKVGQDMLGYQYFAQHGLPVVRVRAFTHTGPGQDDRFVVPAFARQVAEIEAGQREPVLRVGNLDTRRDFTDVRDMVRAYRLAVEMGVPGEVYNIGSGVSIRIGDILERLLALSGVSATVEPDPARQRPADVPVQRADATKFRSLTGWTPLIPFDMTLQDSLDAWRARVRGAVSRP
jgi:GDP-4-dehydro-6-deoxy-D-mannose reductase